MRIKQVRLNGFKRFTDLTLQGLERHHRLVVLIGPNGSGKSSVLESFSTCIAACTRTNYFDRYYFLKAKEGEADDFDQERVNKENAQWAELMSKISIEFFDERTPNWVNGNTEFSRYFYIRGPNRAVHEYVSNGVQKIDPKDIDRPMADVFRSTDSHIHSNYQQLIQHALQSIVNVGERTDEVIGREASELLREIQASVARVFPDLKLIGLGNPVAGGTFVFRKLRSGRWRFKNLSSGEKYAFDLLVDFMIRKRTRSRTIFCVDEPELHMHSELQASLLRELLSQLPAEWQLWIATHSIGMLKTARTRWYLNPDRSHSSSSGAPIWIRR